MPMTLKAHVSRSVVLAALAAAALTSVPAFAQSADKPFFVPASAWTVGSTQLSNVRGLKSLNLPCVLSNEYDNGYVVRFSGGGGQLLALAIDFRQDVFTQGKKYDAMLTIGDAYVKQVSASAFTTSTLIFNLRPLDNFYSIVKNGGEMELNIDGNDMRFDLGKLAGSFDELEGCYAGGKAEQIKPITDGVRSAAVPEVEQVAANDTPTPMPQSFDEIVKNADGDKVTPRANSLSRADNTPMPLLREASRTAIAPQTQQWGAKAGEDIRTVLNRWSDRAGYDLQWQSDQNGAVVQDVNIAGTFEEAVSQLMAENSAVMGIDAHMQTAQGNKDLGPKTNSFAPVPRGPAVQAAIPAAYDSWNAAQGASVKSVLDQWAAKAGVAIVWQTPVMFPVKSAVNMSGSFEEAVQALLDQYMDDSKRPLAQLNTDPETGVRTLMMEIGTAG